MERNRLVRLDPARLHEGTRTVIAAAFNYRPVRRSVYFADYAIGADYHYVLKQRLGEAADALCRRFGGSSRIVVDSAPMRERYWAQRAGIGFVADNGMLCVPGYGMAVVLGFILWTGEALPEPSFSYSTTTRSITESLCPTSGCMTASNPFQNERRPL